MKPRLKWDRIICWLVILALSVLFWISVFKWIGTRFKVQAASKIGPWIGLRIPVFDNLKKGYWYFKIDPEQFQVTPDPAGTSDGIWGLKPSLVGSVGTVVAYSLDSGGQDATGAAVINLSMAASKADPSGLQWEMGFNSAEVASITVAPGPTALSSGKTVSCSSGTVSPVRCLIYGTNQNPILNGVAARVTVQAQSGVTISTVVLSNVVSTSPAATELASIIVPGGGRTTAPIGGVRYEPPITPPAADQPFTGGRANEQMLSCSVPVQGVSTCVWR